jgi:hypothetical protein
MRGLLLTLWLLVPLGAVAYHYGPGQDRLQLDKTEDLLAAARQEVAAGNHGDAVDLFTQALSTLPKDRALEGRRIRLERAKAQLLSGELPAAYDEMHGLVNELQEDATTDPELLADARATQANARYYLTWLMRLEGRPGRMG